MISQIMDKMIKCSEGDLHDIDHFLKVHSYARMIGELEGLDENTQIILEAASIVHDIACPGLRKKYGKANGKLQEIEGMPLAEEFLKDTALTSDQIERVVYLVGHHHTPDNIDGIDYQILIEADYLVNAGESKFSRENIENTNEKIFKTQSGKELLKSIFLR